MQMAASHEKMQQIKINLPTEALERLSQILSGAFSLPTGYGQPTGHQIAIKALLALMAYLIIAN